MKHRGIFFLMLWVCVFGSALTTCPPDFENHGEKCYKIVDVKASWIEAKMFCRVFGGDLAAIESRTEQSLIEGKLKRLHGHTHVENYWLDGTDILSENEWRWMGANGESKLIGAYTHWYPGQPSNGNGTEHCMHIVYLYGLKWNDVQCDKKQSFICEASHDGDGLINQNIIGKRK